jgi:hypothetical protein
VAAGGTSQTQRARLNLIGTGATTVACVDNPGTNSTDCSVSVSTGGTPRTCNANGCYTIAPDGTIDAWGRTTSPSGSASAQALVATFPTSFTTLTNLEMVVSPTGSPGGDGNPHPLDCHVDTLSTSGAVVVMAIAQQITGSGYNSPLLSTQYCSWHAIGH